MAAVARKQKQHYVDNKKLLEEITKYRQAVDEARALDKKNQGLHTTLLNVLKDCYTFIIQT